MGKTEVVAMILAGGQGSRLGVLTKTIAKPAVPFGSRYRIIDFPLSNCVNSGIEIVGVLTQYQPLALNTYVGNGHPWDLDRNNAGAYILPPYQTADGSSWYKGTANAIYQNMSFVDDNSPKYVVILSGDHIYKMDYAAMLKAHIDKGADATIAVYEVPWEEAPRFGILNTKEDDVIEDLFQMARAAAGSNNLLEKNEFEKWSTKNYKKLTAWPDRAVARGKSWFRDKGYFKTDGVCTEEGATQACHLIEFQNFLKDFTLSGERGAPEVGLWKDYLVFAQLFGIADKVAKQFQKLYPAAFEQLSQQAGMDPTSLIYTVNWTNRLSTRAFSNAAGRAGSVSGGGGHSSFGGGGGFSGGGFGGGGR